MQFTIEAEDMVALGRFIEHIVRTPSDRPATVRAFLDMVNAPPFEAGVTFPVDVPHGKAVVWLEQDAGTTSDPVFFSIPKEAILDEAIEAARSAATYNTSDFYNLVFDNPTLNTNLTTAEKVEILRGRMGEYCIGRCM